MRRSLLPLAAIGLIILGYGGYWLAIAHRLRDELDPWAAARRAEGYDVRWQSVSVEGFPLAFRLRFTGAALVAARPFAYEVHAAALVLSARPWTLSRWHFIAPNGAEIATAQGAVFVDAATADGDAAAGAGATRIALRALRLSGGGLAEGLEIASAELSLILPQAPPASHLDPALSLAAAFAAVTLPEPLPSLGTHIDVLSLAATVKGRLPQGPLDRALAAWRDDGGTIELSEGRIVWGPVAATLAGTLALDQSLQPMGALTATIVRPEAAVDAAVAAGSLKPNFAGLAKTVLGALSRPGPDGQPEVHVPITLEGDRLFLGPAPVARLPRVVWE